MAASPHHHAGHCPNKAAFVCATVSIEHDGRSSDSLCPPRPIYADHEERIVGLASRACIVEAVPELVRHKGRRRMCSLHDLRCAV
jgi:hypothetical protein